MWNDAYCINFSRMLNAATQTPFIWRCARVWAGFSEVYENAKAPQKDENVTAPPTPGRYKGRGLSSLSLSPSEPNRLKWRYFVVKD